MTNYEIMRMIRKVSRRRHKAVVYRAKLIVMYSSNSTLAEREQYRIERYGHELTELFGKLK